MSIAAFLAWTAVERLYLNTQKENLLAQAKITAAAVQDTASGAQDSQVYLQTSNVMPGVHTRVLDEQGAVQFSLPLLAENMPLMAPAAENAGLVPSDELRKRPEIQKALAGEPATEIRQVAGRRVLYAAAPVKTGVNQEITSIVYLATPLPPNGLPQDALLQIVGAVLVAALLASLAAIFLARRIAHPVESIACAAQSVSAGNLELQKVPVDGSIKELTTLGNAFNDMVASLRQSEQVRNSFIADVAHELRTPLTVIKGTIETLEDGAVDDVAGRGALLSGMDRESERLIRLVNDLLVLTRADAGALKVHLETLDLGEIVEERCAILSPLAARHGVSLTIVKEACEDGGAFLVQADPDRLAQVIDNLLDNAVRHTPAQSTVFVTVQKEGKEACCAVRDQGNGIPAQHLPFIFERFYRVEGARDRRSGGAGLGLAIVRALVQAQGGRVTARSAEGEGTEITFYMPGK
jgi:signal transduction histidine kinase